VGYGDDHWVALRGGLAVAQEADGNVYLAMPLRNVASGIAVLHGWHLWPRRAGVDDPHPDVEEFRTQTRCATPPTSCTHQCARRSPQADR
jgi:hypothetical protein